MTSVIYKCYLETNFTVNQCLDLNAKIDLNRVLETSVAQKAKHVSLSYVLGKILCKIEISSLH